MGKLYHNERVLDTSTDSINDAVKKVNIHLKKRNIADPFYMRIVELENDRTMFDYGSHIDFYYFES